MASRKKIVSKPSSRIERILTNTEHILDNQRQHNDDLRNMLDTFKQSNDENSRNLTGLVNSVRDEIKEGNTLRSQQNNLLKTAFEILGNIKVSKVKENSNTLLYTLIIALSAILLVGGVITWRELSESFNDAKKYVQEDIL